MNMIAFAIWMVGWPIAVSFDNYVHREKKHSEQAETIVAIFIPLVWIIVGSLIYNYGGV